MPHARARVARARRQRARSRKRLRAGVRPTPQTVAKLRPDPIWTMLRRGTLSQEEADAAHDIRTALLSKTFWGAILAGLSAIFGVFGVEISGAEQAVLVNSVATVGAVLGTVTAIYGRFRADKRIG